MTTTEAGGDFVISRVLDAPRDLVFKAWVEPERLKVWWGPKGFTNPVCEVDPRPGGLIRIHMKAPDGTVYPMTGVYQEVVPPERLVFMSAALDKEGEPMFEVLNVVTFTAQGKQTKLTVEASVTTMTAAAAPYLAGMDEGWSLSLDRLAAFLSKQ